MVENHPVPAPNRDSQKGSLPFQRASCLRSIIHDFARAIPRVYESSSPHLDLCSRLSLGQLGHEKHPQTPASNIVNCNEATRKTPDILQKSTAGSRAESLTDRAVRTGAKLRWAARVSANLTASCRAQIGAVVGCASQGQLSLLGWGWARDIPVHRSRSRFFRGTPSRRSAHDQLWL
jgi:hypothetical protein